MFSDTFIIAKRTLERLPLGSGRWLVLLWLVMCQFPLPVAHSHESILGSMLQEHLQAHHLGSSSTSCGFAQIDDDASHWHWLMPWDCTNPANEEPSEPNRVAVSPLGIWGGTGQSTVPESVGCDAFNGGANLFVVNWIPADFTESDTHVSALACQRQPACFTQTYAGVSIRALVCVSLC